MQNEFKLEVSTDVLLNLNKDYIGSLVEQARVNLSDGQIDALKLLVTAKKGQELFSQLEKTVRPYAESETRLGKGEIYKKFGCDISEKMTGVSYDFSNCDDSEWNDLNAQILDLTEKRKKRETFLKTLRKSIYDENGIEIKPPIHKGKLGLAVSIK